MTKLDVQYIKQTLQEEKLWKVGEADSINFEGWELTLRKEEEIYSPFNYSVRGTHENGSGTGRRYKTMEDAFLHIVNQFNENVNIRNKYNTLDDFYNE